MIRAERRQMSIRLTVESVSFRATDILFPVVPLTKAWIYQIYFDMRILMRQ